MMRAALVVAGLLIPVQASAQLMDILTAPKTLVDRAIEARSMADIAKDNEIVVKVNAEMAKLGTIKAATEIYEQRLLVTGVFDDKSVHDKFERAVRAIPGIRKLYWHAAYVPAGDSRRATMVDWADALVMATKAQGRLVGTAGVADVNFRTTTDAFGTVYLLGRARSGEEARKAVARVKDGKGVRKVVSYVDVRP